MTDVNMRSLALDILLAVNEDGQYSHILLNQVLEKYQYLPKRERAFLTRLVEGTLERQITLDYVINAFSKTKVHKMKPVIRNLLRLGAYQIMYMNSVPDSAAVSEAVKLAKKRGFTGLSGFVNAVLRSIARDGGSRVEWPNGREKPVEALSIAYSIPQWIIQMWADAYGMDKTREILSGFSEEQGFSIRVNLQKTTPEQLMKELRGEGLTVEQLSMPCALFVSGVDYLKGLKSFQEGKFYVQDMSSMRVAELADVQQGDYVIDICAAPGGKSLHLAELLNGTGMVEARDLSARKVELIEENLRRHGAQNLRAVQMDASVHDEGSVEKADVLICDLPCSGLGVLGRKPDIRYRMTMEQAKELSLLQRTLLGTTQDYVKRGGSLLYSTCTIHPAENEENVAWFLREYPEYELLYEEQSFPGGENRDGFFLAKFRRGTKETEGIF
ncbi:MAG: 16S rRNA (cytosine(967)-C(5))-methyltransferase RsmB [Muribaculaceae bacterium]|nr:16S rRNA (cytosine(967)-C(5))-methyltransferase RsmB [Roseburia sp.]MCM1430286.1 16S rRNA (cytosine(967)-C(5))-methyltransferase RsmB [Muribaculaceae bacterium]MCM1492605.1 16S rRNA (cytosine(967)-C(5))-methyltransferase RsmB [Muribaculaceae bacterium]